MASPKKFKAKIARLHVRILWFKIQNTRAVNRSQEDWLMAANRELHDHALVKVGLGTVVSTLPMDNPKEMVELSLSFEATCGVKLSIVEACRQAPLREKLDLLEAAEGFGPEFHRMVTKAVRPPESENLDEEKELDGVPSEGDHKGPRAMVDAEEGV